jgi:hypothetical protein
MRTKDGVYSSSYKNERESFYEFSGESNSELNFTVVRFD